MWLLGAHMSVAGGHALAIDRATAFNMTACQIFTKNANQWNAKPIAPEAAESFRTAVAASEIGFVVAHDSYLINLASPDETLRQRSTAAFGDELQRCAQLGVPWLVTHPGAHMGAGVDEGVGRVASALNQLFDALPDLGVTVLLETTAGQGTSLGRTFEELAMILALVEDQTRVGVCFDTCHVFAAGYDIRETEVYATTMQAFEDSIGLDRLRLFHLNDSKKGLGARVDRHAHIGEGELGKEAFRLLLNDERFAGHPGILETPKGDDGEEDRRNLATLSGLAGVADASLVTTP
ncbi:MAG: apurinic endonuclease Apn1 [Thermomicrobiales bacterium]|jgi:deoxyribonuclease-4|nr:apurinic endonuclease Apn1 [Thermomicrobiales bacterium]